VPLAEAVIAKVVDYLWNRITERRQKREEGLMAVTLRRPDGAEIVWHFQKGVSMAEATRAVTEFTEGHAVQRVLEG